MCIEQHNSAQFRTRINGRGSNLKWKNGIHEPEREERESVLPLSVGRFACCLLPVSVPIARVSLGQVDLNRGKVWRTIEVSL